MEEWTDIDSLSSVDIIKAEPRRVICVNPRYVKDVKAKRPTARPASTTHVTQIKEPMRH
jgi:hypothetical protein